MGLGVLDKIGVLGKKLSMYFHYLCFYLPSDKGVAFNILKFEGNEWFQVRPICLLLQVKQFFWRKWQKMKNLSTDKQTTSDQINSLKMVGFFQLSPLRWTNYRQMLTKPFSTWRQNNYSNTSLFSSTFNFISNNISLVNLVVYWQTVQVKSHHEIINAHRTTSVLCFKSVFLPLLHLSRTFKTFNFSVNAKFLL